VPSTYKDIQRMTGLSLSTISKYFNGGNVMEENRKAIDRAVAKLDFRMNEYARGLKSKRSKTIGVLIPELNSTFNTSIIADVEDILRMQGYGTIVCDCRLNKKIEKEALEFLLSKMVDGIITIPFDNVGEHLKMAQLRNIPVILIDRLVTGYKADAVIVNNVGAVEMAVNEFVENGHKRIAILCGPDGIFTMKARMDGFKKALLTKHLELFDEYQICEELSISGGYAGAKYVLGLQSLPTALLCANHEMTLGAIIALTESGVKIPAELSVIGFDNLMLSQIVKPNLTIIVQPMREIAENAARLMLERLESESTKGIKIIELDASMIKGNSVQKL
jgi:LacI family transcriptional regulator